MPRASGGFTVHEPTHRALEGADLCYGGALGASSAIAGYEGDGLTDGFEQGLPFATGEDGALPNTPIIAMAVTRNEEENHGIFGTCLYAGPSDLHVFAELLYGENNAENQAKARYGSSMIVNVPKGSGDIFDAGTTEWVNALKLRDPFVEKITRNVLDRYQSQA